MVFLMAVNGLFAQRKKGKPKDYRKENFEQTGRPGDKYTYTSGSSVYNPQTGKYESKEGEWKKQPDAYQYSPKEWSKPKHKRSVYGKNPIRRLFKIKPRSAKPGDKPSDQPGKKETPFTTGEEKEKKE